MATKMSNLHISKIINESKKYHTPTVFVYLAHICNEIKAKKQDLILNEVEKEKAPSLHFLIQIGKKISTNDNFPELYFERQALVDVLIKYINIDRRTIYAALLELENLKILNYNRDYLAWELTGMETMIQSKTLEEIDSFTSEKQGYTLINNILLSDRFINSKPYQKKLWLYLSLLRSSKNGKTFKSFNDVDFDVNLLNTKTWLKIFNTKSIYYAKYRFKKFLNDNEEIMWFPDIKLKLEGKFKYRFNIPAINSQDREEEYVWSRDYKEMNLVSNKIDEFNEYYRKTENKEMTISFHQRYQLVRAIRNLKYIEVKEQVVTAILKKYAAIQIFNSREKIKSLPAYAFSVARELLSQFQTLMKNTKMQKVEEFV